MMENSLIRSLYSSVGVLTYGECSGRVPGVLYGLKVSASLLLTGRAGIDVKRQYRDKRRDCERGKFRFTDSWASGCGVSTGDKEEAHCREL